MEDQGQPRGCGAPKGTQALPWLRGQEPGVGSCHLPGHWDPHLSTGQTEADASLVPLEPFLMLQHLQRGHSSSDIVPDTCLAPEPPMLPQPTTSTPGWDAGGAGADPWGSVAAQEPASSSPGAISKASSCLSARNICQSLRAACQGSSAAIPELIPRPTEMRIFQQESSERVYFSVSPLGLFH